MLELQRRHGTGVLFITHDFGVVAETGAPRGRAALGDLVEVGDKHDVLQRPQHDYTKMLIGAVPTLRLHARRRRHGPPVVLSARGLEKTYLDKGWFGKARTVHAAQDVNFEIRAARRWASSANRARARAPWRAAWCA
jgi:peptide/nickel transport system ATP-binding protein